MKTFPFRRAILATLLPVLALLLLAAGRAPAAELDLDLKLGTPVVLAGRPETAFLKVSLIATAERQDDKARVPVNVALVLDRSGSMAGAKMEHAKEAAILFIDRLQPEDIVSVITYESTVEVLIPATKVSDREELRGRIRAIQTANSTALFAGVSKGAAEVRKFLSQERVNRIVLLSDGLANVGPSSPEALAELGRSFAQEGIAVSTIGLGLDYNEDLMYKLAAASDGNAAFAEEPQELAKFFDRELRAVTEVVAGEVEVTLEVAEGIRPIRVLGDRGTIAGQTVSFSLNQLYNNWENYFIVELALPAGEAGSERVVGTAKASWLDIAASQPRTSLATAAILYTENESEVAAALVPDVIASSVRLVAQENNRKAVALRDAGQIQQAQQVLFSNSGYINRSAENLPAEYKKELQELDETVRKNAVTIEQEGEWNRQRKQMNLDVQKDSYQLYQ
ncbi:MAG: Ca-activated chloride channel [Candidatus Sumerlaeota bacterium]|nr:Ca-activated chloride channel [Candidatus Sumerlaeota bacterium]